MVAYANMDVVFDFLFWMEVQGQRVAGKEIIKTTTHITWEGYGGKGGAKWNLCGFAQFHCLFGTNTLNAMTTISMPNMLIYKQYESHKQHRHPAQVSKYTRPTWFILCLPLC